MNSLKILITGGAGFVGASLCLNLKKKYPEYSIVAFDNLKRRGGELNLPEFYKNKIEFIHGDIRNKEDFDSVGSFDILIEASAEPSVLAGLNSEPTYVINNNFMGSINCFNACIKNKAKIIFLSTSRVYPIESIENANYVELESRFNFSDNQTIKGISHLGVSEELNLEGSRSFYGSTKLASELFISEYNRFYELQTTVLRLGVISGPKQMGKIDQGVITYWLAKHYWKESLKYIGYGGLGKQVRDVLHIQDLIELIDMQIHNFALFNGKTFNAGGGFNSSASLLEMTKICQQMTGNLIPIEKVALNRKADLRIYITDNTKIYNETGWKPKKNIVDIFTDIFKWINQNESHLKSILST